MNSVASCNLEQCCQYTSIDLAKIKLTETESTMEKPNNNVTRFLKDNLLLIITLSGVFLGAILGFSLRPFNLSGDSILLISYPGELFMRILKLVILPLVVSSLITGSASLNAKLNGRIAMRTLIYFVCTSFLNACLGVTLALVIHPGTQDTKVGLNSAMDYKKINVLDSFLDVGRNMFPDNIFQAFFQQTQTIYIASNARYNKSSGDEVIEPEFIRSLRFRDGTNNIGIICFCLLFGTVLGTLDNKSGYVVIDFFKAIYEIVMKIMSGVMWLTPFGICSVICGKILSVTNVAVIVSQLGWFIITVVIGLLIYQLFILQFIYFIFIRRNPFKFYWGLTPGILTAFATASTAAALPVTFRCMDEKVKVDERISRFILPIGCTINMDGTALFLGAATVFIAQMNSVPLDLGNIATVCLVATAGSMSSASVPSAALVLMLMVLSSIGCPTDDVSLLFVIDWLVDRCRTTNNMLGDCYASAVVEHLSAKELREAVKQEQVLSGAVDPSTKSVIINIPNGMYK